VRRKTSGMIFIDKTDNILKVDDAAIRSALNGECIESMSTADLETALNEVLVQVRVLDKLVSITPLPVQSI
jgi:hypothetical protein